MSDSPHWKNGSPRPKKPSADGFFGWSSNRAVDMITQHFAHHPGPLVYTLGLYLKLTDIASRQRNPNKSEEFTKSHRDLAAASGMSVSQLKKLLAILSDLGLVAWRENFTDLGGGIRSQTSNTYRLLSVKQ